MKFKKNLHLAKRCHLDRINQEIKDYNPAFSPPKYLLFIKALLEEGFPVKRYVAGPSKYIFVYDVRDEEVYKIRFSNHRPIYEKEMENDCDFYVGISHKQTSTTAQILEKIIRKPKDLSQAAQQ